MKHKLFIILCIFILSGQASFADNLYLKNGDEVKGIVVEVYDDRVVISTYEGEKTFLKNDIKNIVYDLTEQNLVALGDSYMARREYFKAYFYYERAQKINPKYQIARDKMNYIMGYLFRMREQDKEKDVQKMQALEEWAVKRELPDENTDKNLKDFLGIEFAEEAERIVIKGVSKKSPAGISGLKTGDILVSVWGKLTGYMPLDSVEQLLLEESTGEIKIAIERNIKLAKSGKKYNYKDFIGGELAVLVDGLTIVDLKDGGSGKKAGLEKNDLIMSINGQSTRYMPFKEAVKMIEDTRNKLVTFTVVRNITMWRG